MAARLRTNAVHRISSCMLRIFWRIRRENGSSSRPSASVILLYPKRPPGARDAPAAAVWIVIVKLVGLLPIVITCGVNVAVAPGGRPVAESVIGKGNGPLFGSRLKVKVTGWPGSTLWL